MPGILTPELALRHLLQLSTDVRAALVLATDGGLLAGEEAIAPHARELLGMLSAQLGDGAGELVAPLRRAGGLEGSALVARAATGPALVVAAGPHALLPLLRHDLAMLLRALGSEAVAAPADTASGPGDPLAGPADTASGPGDPLAGPADTASGLADPLAGPADPQTTPADPLAGVSIWDASRCVQVLEPTDSAARTAIFAGLGLLDMGKP